MKQDNWKSFTRYLVKYRPGDVLWRWLSWGFLAFFGLVWFVMVLMSMKSRSPESSPLAIVIAFPLLFLGLQVILQLSNRSVLKNLDRLTKELNMEARCDFGAPLWVVSYPHLVGEVAGVSVFIQQLRRGKTGNFTQLLCQGSKVNQLDQAQLVEVLNRHKLALSTLEKTEGRLSIWVQESLFAKRTGNWLSETLTLLSREV